MPPARSSSPALPYSKDEKTKKPLRSFTANPLLSSSPSNPRRRIVLLLLLFSSLCLLVGIAGITSAVIVSRRPPRTVSVFRCGRTEDTWRTFRSRSAGEGGLSDRPKILGLVGVQTRFGSSDRRAALRSTWFPPDPDGLLKLERATGLAFRFVIGRSKDGKKISELKREEDRYHDFMLIDVEEEYIKLPYKTLEFFKAAFNLFDAEYYVKVDDAVYLRPDRLATLLAVDRKHNLTYIGCMKKGPVVTDPKMKWYESSGHLIGNEYFLHAYGPVYALSAEVVAALSTARPNSLRMFNNEDVTVGSWMLSMNVNYEDNRAICDPKCTPSSIAVWDMTRCSGLCNPIARLKNLHNTSMCSKSPTLSPEDI